MKLRKLELKDASFMLEWMHDKSVVENMQTDFTSFTIENCENFIKNSVDDKSNVHLAVVDDNDEYMGTVSLKNIKNNRAEFAITVRACAMGKGFSKYGMTEIIRIGFDEMKLEAVYWCVSPENKRAVRFYDKNNYKRITVNAEEIEGYTKEQINSYLWYEVIESNEKK